MNGTVTGTVIRSENGSAAIESLVATVLVVTVLTGGLTLTYSAFAHAWLRRVAYEASICLSTSAPARGCEQTLRAEIAQALPIGSVLSLSARKSVSLVETTLRWKIAGLTLDIEDRRALPLLARNSRSMR